MDLLYTPTKEPTLEKIEALLAAKYPDHKIKRPLLRRNSLIMQKKHVGIGIRIIESKRRFRVWVQPIVPSVANIVWLVFLSVVFAALLALLFGAEEMVAVAAPAGVALAFGVITGVRRGKFEELEKEVAHYIADEFN
ncbi:MAG: hypothetical protein P9L99_06160 [Candidatus Lernaella stagnicola]|nr:hypothetical protein [Candidatus Lernaella stagnicola]